MMQLQPTRAALFVLAALVFLTVPFIKSPPTANSQNNYYLYLPSVGMIKAGNSGVSCEVAGTSYATIPTYDAPDPRPDSNHADLNLGLRGYEPTNGHLGLVDYGGPTDTAAPQLYGLFSDNRTPAFVQNYRVYDWNWGCNCRGPLMPYPGQPTLQWPVTFAHVATRQGERLRLPNRQGGEIDAAGYKALVIYASETRMTLKYTRSDDVVSGYTVHVENVCVEPTLLALYREANRNGRTSLPALRPGDAIGVANGASVGLAIRDAGAFMDPRSRKDWWVGRSGLEPPTGDPGPIEVIEP